MNWKYIQIPQVHTYVCVLELDNTSNIPEGRQCVGKIEITVEYKQ